MTNAFTAMYIVMLFSDVKYHILYTLLQLTTTQTHSLHTTALSWNKELNLNTRRRMIKDFLVLNVYGMAERKMIPPKSKEE